jgi:probable F420-dependent oxidoreductase
VDLTPTHPQFSIGLQGFSETDPGDWRYLFDRALAAEAAGVDRVVASDHVVFGEHLEAYGRSELGGSAGGTQPTGPDGHWLEPMTLLSVIAGMTSRVRLGTNILQAALRRPVVLAKSTATLDVLSGGRLDLGVGVGWQREEYQAAGLDFVGRGRLLDHSLEVCQELWQARRASYDSAELSFEAIHMMPKPRQPGGVPIWVSGTVNPRVVQRLARFGSGWIPWGPAVGNLAVAIEQMRQGVDAAGGDPSKIGVVGSVALLTDTSGRVEIDRTLESTPALIEAGATDIRISRLPLLERSAMEELLTALVETFHSLTGRP